MLRRIFPTALFALTVLLFGTVARADTITVAGVQSGNLATATIVCEFNAQTNTFTFTITNTSAITSPGSTATITAIGFDLPPAGNASPSGLNGFTGMQAPAPSSNFIFSDANVGSIPQFSSAVADFAFLTGNSGTFGTGSVNDGLLPGESASFTVSGAAFAGFTEEQICNSILVRFEQVGAGGSDVAVSPDGNWDPDPDTTQIIGGETGSQATAELTCSFNAQTNTFTFTIENTSPNDARITAIGFDLPPDGNASPFGLNGFTGSNSGGFGFSDADLGTVPGFDGAVLDFAFVTGKNFAGGKANSGLAPGESATFTVSGAAFTGFTEEQICEAIFVRFQRVGADGEGSDVGVPWSPGGASITIIKDAQPNSTTAFEFTATGQVNQNFALWDNGVIGPDRITFSNLTGFGAANAVTITESASPGFNLVAINCVSNANGGSGINNNTINVPSRFATIQLEEGESVVCTFVNAVTTTPTPQP